MWYGTMPALKDGTDWQKPFKTFHSIDPEVFIQVHPSKTLRGVCWSFYEEGFYFSFWNLLTKEKLSSPGFDSGRYKACNLEMEETLRTQSQETTMEKLGPGNIFRS